MKRSSDAASEIRAYLETAFTEPIRDPLWKNIYLSPGLLELIGSERFQQLGRIKQLGPAFHLYPGAVHTRLSHSLGVFHIARKLLSNLIMLSEPQLVEQIGLTSVGAASFLAAALLHDLGHFPFTHSLKELPLKEHEKLGAELIMGDDQLCRVLHEEAGADPVMTAAIIDSSMNTDSTSGQPSDGIAGTSPVPEEEIRGRSSRQREIQFYRQLLSGPLDPDKLDYLNRDAYFCGVPYGLQDVDFIIDRLRITPSGGIGILESGTGAIEHLLFSKYLMYRNVYWHRTVRSATAMIKKALSEALRSDLVAPESLYLLDDESFNRLCLQPESDGTPFELIEMVMNRSLHTCAAEFLFNPEKEAHNRLQDRDYRMHCEQIICCDLVERNLKTEPWEIIIDLPEPVTFEAAVPVIGPDGQVRDFHQTGPVFSQPVIDGFTRSLRRIRIFVPDPRSKASAADHHSQSAVRNAAEGKRIAQYAAASARHLFGNDYGDGT